MTATAHTLVAGAIASHFSDPVTAGAIAFSSHFVMDCIPHWDLGTNWRLRPKWITGALALTDTLIAITVPYFLFKGNVPLPTLGIAMIASILPDWLETPWYIFFANPTKKEPGVKASLWERLAFGVYKFENVFHTKAQFPLGAITQVAAVLFFWVILK